MRTLPFLAISIIALSACSTPVFDQGVSMFNPPVIGGGDDLRLGSPPPASPADVRIAVISEQQEEGEGLTELRREALRESAQRYGSQMGFSRRTWEIGQRLQDRARDLSEAYRFDRVVSTAPVKAGVVIPPVVSRSFNAFDTDSDGREASVADEYLTIVSAGRIAPVAPTWRDYLLFGAPEPEIPASVLMPSSTEERDVFRTWFDDGWAAGVALADAELENRLARLERDFTGMLQYRRLVAQGMMDRMVLADADFGVTGENGEMRIGSRTVRIVDDAEFQTNPLRWRLRAVTQRDMRIVEEGSITPRAGGID